MKDARNAKKIVGEILGELVEGLRNGGTGAPKLRIGLMSAGSELVRDGDAGQGELIAGAIEAMRADKSIDVVMIGPKKTTDITKDLSWIETDDCEADIAEGVNRALANGEIAAAVALHYPFPLGVTTIGRVATPFHGKPMIVASTTGTASTDRVEAMVRNALYGQAVARAIGIEKPTVGILNTDGAPSVSRILGKLRDAGYEIRFGESVRKDGGSLLRGNDLLAGAVDVCVTDTLTGNILMKMFSAWNSGGAYESTGFGYGPSTGEGWEGIVSIISRASGAPVIANALRYTAEAARGDLPRRVSAELAAAKKAGLDSLLAPANAQPAVAKEIAAPPAEPTGEEIHGVDVLSIDDATRALWEKGIYAEAAMGCTGPVVKVPERAFAEAKELLVSLGYI